MWLKNNIKELISLTLAISFIVFTGLRWIPIEAFIGLATAAITYYFEEKSKESLKHELLVIKEKLRDATGKEE